MSDERCVCEGWACDGDGVMAILLTDHHPNCKHYRPLPAIRKLLSAFVDGIEEWAGEEDGVHPAVWPAFCSARALLGRKLTDEQAAQLANLTAFVDAARAGEE